MEILLYILAAGLIALGVIAWHKRDKIFASFKTAPIVVQNPSLSGLVDEMIHHRNEALRCAGELEKRAALARADIDTAVNKLLPVVTAKEPTP